MLIKKTMHIKNIAQIIIINLLMLTISEGSGNMNIVTVEQEDCEVLKTPAQEVKFPLSKEDKELISEMKKMSYEFGGVSLAAPQVGVSKRIAIIYIPESAALLRDDVRVVDMHAIINPEYWPTKNSAIEREFEGCYSVENIMGKVPRFNSIILRYENEYGIIFEKIVDGFYARVLQHEIDHLNGILITDRLTPDCVQGDKKSMLAIRRKELSPEKRKHFDELVMKKIGVSFTDE